MLIFREGRESHKILLPMGINRIMYVQKMRLERKAAYVMAVICIKRWSTRSLGFAFVADVLMFYIVSSEILIS